MAFTRGYVMNLLEAAGYTDIDVEYKDFLLPGIPDFLIAPSIAVGAVLERIPIVRMTSQSIFITATRQG
jgi:hypothetical protein